MEMTGNFSLKRYHDGKGKTKGNEMSKNDMKDFTLLTEKVNNFKIENNKFVWQN